MHAGSPHWLLRIRLTGGAQTVGHSFVFRPKLALELEVSAGICVGSYYFFLQRLLPN